jgi:hypothetical protein
MLDGYCRFRREAMENPHVYVSYDSQGYGRGILTRHHTGQVA